MLTTPPGHFKRTSKILPPNSPYPSKNLNHSKPPRNRKEKRYNDTLTRHPAFIPSPPKRHRHHRKSLRNRDQDYPNHGQRVTSSDRNNPPFRNFNGNMEGKDNLYSAEEKSKSNILWSSDSINTLKTLMDFINNHKLMQPLGHIVRYYINKYQPYDNEYKILSADTIPENIDRDILIMAYICEIRIKTYHFQGTIVTDDMIYRSLGNIVHEVLDDLFDYSSWDLDYGEVYMINMLNNILPRDPTENTKDIITTSYYTTKHIMKYIEYSQNHILEFMGTLHVRSHDLDLSILTPFQIRECLNILNTKRKLYLRMLLVIAHHMLHLEISISNSWLFDRTKITNFGDFGIMLEDILMEIKIQNRWYVKHITESK